MVVIGQDAFLLHKNTTVTFAPLEPTPEPTQEPEVASKPKKAPQPTKPTPLNKITGFTLRSGMMLSVFGTGPKLIKLPTATIGIRGTGIFVQAAAPPPQQQDYMCLCYGIADIRIHSNPKIQATITAQHHDVAYFLSAEAQMKTAPMLNHTDDELIMLEALVNRTPPFSKSSYYSR